MPSSGYTVITFVANQLLTSTVMNQMGANDASFNNGNGFNDGILVGRHYAANSITSAKIDWAAATGKVWWEELGRATASGGANPTSLSVTIASRRYLQILFKQFSGGVSLTSTFRYNNDSGANYQYRTSENGGVDSNANAQTGFSLGANALEGMHGEYMVNNDASKYKVGHGFNTYWAAGATQIYRNSQATKWENNSVIISSVQMIATGGSYKDGSEIIVLGHD